MGRTRSYEVAWRLVILVTIMAVGPTTAEDSVGLYNATLKQVVTSSSLRWATWNKETTTNYVIGAESEQGPIYLCRVLREGDLILGQLKPEYTSCTLSGSKKYRIFEVLENIDNASLIYWKPWSKFNSKPSGAVVLDNSLDSVFIGRSKSESVYSHNIGRIAYESTTGQLITVGPENIEIIEKFGEILVEIVPTNYRLENVVLELDKENVRQSDPVITRDRVLQNDGQDAADVVTLIEYNYTYTLSWGHGHGIAIGLNTVIVMADGVEYPPIAWANPFRENRTETFELKKYLEPGTACNATSRANYTHRDVPYSGKLITYYKEHDPRTRQIVGERSENTLEVDAVYGDVYFLSNNSLVPTTTTTTSTTTTTTTTTTVPPPPHEDNNDIASPMKDLNHSNIKDSNDMQGDSSENMEKTPVSNEDNLNSATTGGLGSINNGADMKLFTVTVFCLPIFALLF